MTRVTGEYTRRSARFVAWVRAWRAGLIPYDDVADEIEANEDHVVCEATGPGSERPLREALAGLSGLHPDHVRLVLPVPGDPRGLPGPGTPFTGRALACGEGVIAGPAGLVPEVRTHVSGSGDAFFSVVWWTYPLPPQPPGAEPGTSPAEAEAELSAALAEATTRLTALDVAQWRPELAGALAALRNHDDAGELPPVFNPRARRLYARASMLDRLLALADDTSPGGAVNSYEARQRDEALRPLVDACRRAMVAACNAPVDA
ncbi:MAG TPA: hypothetical protein VKY81_12880 [Natronosporangium sp.]|nr:hypothetical protein [Natronosporangium sp.]